MKKKYSSEEYNNLDIYQINCTFYSALGNRDDADLLARAIQFFAPGIPQVYYVGMLAGENDLELLEATKREEYQQALLFRGGSGREPETSGRAETPELCGSAASARRLTASASARRKGQS